MARVNSIPSFYIHTVGTSGKEAMKQSAAYFQKASGKVYKGLNTNQKSVYSQSTVRIEVMSIGRVSLREEQQQYASEES